jgi:OmcA/MtrC family decaheme c-type cytochrome
VVTTAKCNACHVQLGVGPTFHAGQRNDSPTCAFCHKPNQTSSGWSANAKDFIHGIHGAGKRTVPFTWHAVTPTGTYADVTYPGILNKCEMCHNAGQYDFSSSAQMSAYQNMLPSTVGVRTYDGRKASNPTGYFTQSPYVQDPTNNTPVSVDPTVPGDYEKYSVDYGYGFSTSNVTFTLPDGIGTLSGTTGPDATNPANTITCSLLTPCACGSTTSTTCSVTLLSSGFATALGISAKYSMATRAVGATTDTVLDCSTNACTCTNVKTATTGPCTATLKTCSPAAPCDAQDTTLVKSPIVAACTACHDTDMAIDHMRTNGGSFYETRAVYKVRDEECLVCHGPNRLASIALVHSDKTP